MIPDYEYTKNLGYFLQHSEEDGVDSNTFLRDFSIKCKHVLDWLDVGTGPGTKPIKILKGTKEHKGLLDIADISLDLLEPSQDWQKIALQNFQENRLSHTIRKLYPIRWEEFIKKKKEKYDLISFFHSVYGIDIESLRQVPRFLKKTGYACIVVESPNSDLHKIKKAIFPYIHKKELVSSSKTIVAFLQQAGIEYDISEQEPEQKFYVDELLSADAPMKVIPLSFIVQTSPEDYNRIIPPEMQNEIEKELRKLIKKDGNRRAYLNVPDKFIWINKS